MIGVTISLYIFANVLSMNNIVELYIFFGTNCGASYGLKHSDISLRNCLQTVIWRPDFAAHVQLLDFREWGHCPRLENEYGRPWDDQVMSNDHFT